LDFPIRYSATKTAKKSVVFADPESQEVTICPGISTAVKRGLDILPFAVFMASAISFITFESVAQTPHPDLPRRLIVVSTFVE